jgi:two-component system, chemotaxis family, sensor kinase CheA
MDEEKKALAETVNQLAFECVMLEPDNMMAFGSVLEKLEKIEQMSGRVSLEPAQGLSRCLKTVVEKVILNEFNPPQQGIELLGEGVKLLQKKIAPSQAALSSPEEETFWKKVEPFAGPRRATPPPGQNGAAIQKGSSREPVDLSQDLDLFNDFITEAVEHLGTIELNIINLEQSPRDKECINAIFRPFHTIKGVSGFLNLQEINTFSHAMESLLDRARNDKLHIDQEVIDFILEAVDLLKKMILDLKAHLDAGRPAVSPVDLAPTLKKIEFLQESKSSPLLSNKASLLQTETVPPSPPLGEILSSKGIVSPAKVEEALREQAVDGTGKKLGEILVQDFEVKPQDVLEGLRDQRKIFSQMAEATVKVDTCKLDTLVDLVGELVITQSLVQQNPVFSSIHDQKLTRDFSQLRRITIDLQKNAMSLRMTPIRNTFQKMIRLVRDLAKKSGKVVDLMMSGEETEIDRNMVDSLYDPLVHMIRNAVDHGIETPERRKEAGKAERGRVGLKAHQKGGSVLIEIEDDGQGLNRTKILKKARERGGGAEDAQLSDFQIDNLIFEPGFSTADQITDVSGRGVGMDVVKKAIEKLKGKVEIFSTEGKGCRFVIRVPLTLAILDGIIVRIGEERFIVPTVFIKETVRPRREDVSTVQKRGELINIRNTLLPLVRLHHLLGVVPEKKEPCDALVIVVENDGRQKGLMVDDLIGKQEVVIKNLGEKLKDVRGVGGATIMGDGRVGLILDVHGIFEIEETL